MHTCYLFVASLMTASASFVLLVDAAGAYLYVDPLAGRCDTYQPTNRTCLGGSETNFPTLTEAASVAGPGTTVWIRAGTYREQLAPLKSGIVENEITFRSFPGEAVFLAAAPAILLFGRSSIIIDGFTIQDTTWLEARGAHSNILRNCIFKRTPAAGTTGNARFIQSHYNLIVSNVFEAGHDNLLLIDANYNRVIRNTFTEGRHSLLGIRCGDFNVVRSNYFSNSQQKIMEVYDCGLGTSAVPNSLNSTRRNLIEHNIFADASSYYSTSGGNGIQYAGQDGIIRQNLIFHSNVGIGMGSYADEGLFNVNNRIYHNVFYRNDIAGVALIPGTTNNVFKNNIFAANQGCIPDGFGISPGQIVFRQPFSVGLRFENNNLFYQIPGQPVIEQEFGGGFTLAAITNAHPGLFLNTLEVDPQFVNATNNDFSLRASSPMIDAGAFLTRTLSAGSGTNMVVEDPRAFYDGFGIVGEQGDLVQLQGQTSSARILRIDLASGTLALDRSVTWTNSQGVSLRFSGAAPDIGAFEYTVRPRVSPPRNIRLTGP